MTEKVHVLNFVSGRPGVKSAENDLGRRARQIGTLAGRVAALLRQAREKLNDEASGDDLRGSAESRAQNIRQAAAARAQEWRRHAERGYQQARERARQAVRDYPVHAALAAGVAGFVVGAALRIRRTHRAR